MVEPWAVEFEKSERMDHTYREVTLSQYNRLPPRLKPFSQRHFTNVSFESLRYYDGCCVAHGQACSRTCRSHRTSYGQENGDVKRLFGLTLSQENEPEPQKKNKKIHFCNETAGK